MLPLLLKSPIVHLVVGECAGSSNLTLTPWLRSVDPLIGPPRGLLGQLEIGYHLAYHMLR